MHLQRFHTLSDERHGELALGIVWERDRSFGIALAVFWVQISEQVRLHRLHRDHVEALVVVKHSIV